jgi:adenine-specific DNA-methyltransferase
MSDSHGIEKIDINKIKWRSSNDFFESLGEALDKLDDKDEKYDFTWVGKRKAIIEAGAPINKTFRPDMEGSKNWDNTENLFIEGDNLDALKLLQESYLGKVKMIYIDPPYNTGKDFVYHDNFKADVEEYDEATDYKDQAGNIQFKKNEKSNGRYHSDWLSMMYSRLRLARNLLTQDGVIFISIDDNELANLKKLCDEIFGEINYIGILSIENNPKGRKNSDFLSVNNDFCLIYARDKDASSFIENIPKSTSDMKLDENGDFVHNSGKRVLVGENTFNKEVANTKSEKHYSLYYDPANNKLEFRKENNVDDIDNELIKNGYIRFISSRNDKFIENTYTQSKLLELFESNSLEFKKDKVFGKNFSDKIRIKSLIVNRSYEAVIDGKAKAYKIDVKTTSAGQALKALFKTQDEYFTAPKNTGLISLLATLFDDKNMTILDFFSGSGTTAHAVMELNAEDGGNRKWIMVQLYEHTDDKSEAYRAGFKSIPDIARERIRLAGDEIAAEYSESKVDYGFRALSVDETNHKEVYRSAGELNQSALLDIVDNVKSDRSDIDLLYGVLTKFALELNRPIEKREIAGSDVYLYDYFGEVSGLIGCFSEQISENAIKEIANLKPLTAVFRDSSFADSQAKVNLSEHFRVLSPETKVKVI